MSRRLPLLIGTVPLVALAIGTVCYLRMGRPAATQAAATLPAATLAVVAQPKAVIAEDVYDLGILNPGDRRRHAFVIRNAGAADLTLTLGSTTCKCTLADLDETRVPPGGSHFVELEWRAEHPQFLFRQGAVINTNDPALPAFELMGEGSVRVKLGTLPESAHLADVPRNTPRTLSVLLYSQAFAAVRLGRIESSSPAISATVGDAAPTTAPPQESRFFRDLVVTLQPQTKPGRYDGVLRIPYVGRCADDSEETGDYELHVSFEVVGDITLHGRDIVGNVLTFGAVQQATGAKRQAYLHFRGESADGLHLNFKRSKPEGLRVQIGEVRRLTPTLARYPISIEVPPGTALQAHTEQALGEVELTTSHADYPAVRIPLSLIVVP